MAEKRSPAFQFYPSDFLGSAKVRAMSNEEIGIYTLLLCLDWEENGFAFDEGSLSRWCGSSVPKFKKAWIKVGRCFVERDGRMYNPRLDLEREKQAAWREKSAKGGLANAARWQNGGSTVVQAPLEPKGELGGEPKGSTLISHLSNTTTPLPPKGDGDGYPPEFELLWKAYPKKAGPNNKRSAFKQYSARLNQGIAYDAMFEGVKRYRAYLHATGKEGTEYVKMAATFLGPDRHFAETWEPPAQKPSSLDLREAMMRKRGYV